MTVALFINWHEMCLALFEKRREMPVTPLKGLLPLKGPSYLPLDFCLGQPGAPTCPTNCRPLSAPLFSHNKHCPPASQYKYTTVYCRFILEVCVGWVHLSVPGVSPTSMPCLCILYENTSMHKYFGAWLITVTKCKVHMLCYKEE